MIDDAIGLLILAVAAALVAAAAGFVLLFSLDLLSAGVSWLQCGPVTGWSLLGAFVGFGAGAIRARKAVGASDDKKQIYFAVSIAAALLLAAGASSPAGRAMLGR